jgi:hypothetical protein
VIQPDSMADDLGGKAVAIVLHAASPAGLQPSARPGYRDNAVGRPEADTVLLPEGLNALKRMARLTDLKIDGSYLNLDGVFDSRHNRKAIFNARLIPNIKENPRNRKTPKRGRKRLFNAAIHPLGLRVERTFAWEDKFKRLLLRFEFIQQRHYGMKLMGYTLINLRHSCGA